MLSRISAPLATLLLLVAAVLALVSPVGAAVSHGTVSALPAAAPPSSGINDFTCRPSAAHPNPVVLVHGLGANATDNWAYLGPRLASAGYCVFSLTYGTVQGETTVGGLEPMEQSSAELAAFVDRVRAATGAAKVDLVGHSEGTVMPQYYLKFRGGAAVVDKYVALTPLYKGTTLWGLGTLASQWAAAAPQLAGQFAALCGSCQEFLPGSPFLTHLYADGVYAVPGVTYTTIMTRYDELVTPYTSGYLNAPNATNHVLQDGCSVDFAGHGAVAFDPRAAQIVLNALDPAHAKPPPCSLFLLPA